MIDWQLFGLSNLSNLAPDWWVFGRELKATRIMRTNSRMCVSFSFAHESRIFNERSPGKTKVSDRAYYLIHRHYVDPVLTLVHHVLECASFRDSRGLDQPLGCIFPTPAHPSIIPLISSPPFYPPPPLCQASASARKNIVYSPRLSASGSSRHLVLGGGVQVVVNDVETS